MLQQTHANAADVTGQTTVGNGGGGGVAAVVTVPVHGGGPAPSSDGLMPLEPPLSSSDYNFSLDEQENLDDLFNLF